MKRFNETDASVDSEHGGENHFAEAQAMKRIVGYDLSDIREAHLDAMISLAFQYGDALETEAILAEDEARGDAEKAAPTDAAYVLFLEKWERQKQAEKREERAERRKRLFPKALAFAACAVLALAIAAPIAIANVGSIRVRVMRFLIEMQEDHVDISLQEDKSESFEAPADWLGGYYPSYIPEGFAITHMSPYVPSVTYSKNEDSRIEFNEYTEFFEVSLDREDAKLSWETINGISALVIEKRGYVTVTWDIDDTYFVLSANLSYDEVLRIARSVVKIL